MFLTSLAADAGPSDDGVLCVLVVLAVEPGMNIPLSRDPVLPRLLMVPSEEEHSAFLGMPFRLEMPDCRSMRSLFLYVSFLVCLFVCSFVHSSVRLHVALSVGLEACLSNWLLFCLPGLCIKSRLRGGLLTYVCTSVGHSYQAANSTS